MPQKLGAQKPQPPYYDPHDTAAAIIPHSSSAPVKFSNFFFKRQNEMQALKHFMSRVSQKFKTIPNIISSTIMEPQTNKIENKTHKTLHFLIFTENTYNSSHYRFPVLPTEKIKNFQKMTISAILRIKNFSFDSSNMFRIP